MKAEIRRIISQLKNGSININDVPEEYRQNPEIIKAERRLGLRTVIRRGYDVISDKYFVEELLIVNAEKDIKRFDSRWFDEFQEYSQYLDGNIYQNACYYKLDPERLPKEVDAERLLLHSSFIEIFQ